VRARKSEVILDAARRVFLERGFDAATVEEVADRAEVSKATVYNNFHDKHALLEAMVDRVTAESKAILAAAFAPLDDHDLLRDRFTRVSVALLRGVLRPEVVQMRRLAIATAIEFPESAALYWQRGPAATIEMLSARLTRMASTGEIACENPGSTATLFAYALVGPFQDRMLFDTKYLPTADEFDDHVQRSVSVLMGCAAPA
jgi:TetR/AcrR family transcriptional repressor of mexJK operon